MTVSTHLESIKNKAYQKDITIKDERVQLMLILINQVSWRLASWTCSYC